MKLKTALITIMLAPIYMVSQNFPYTALTVREGMPANDIYAIAQDNEGYLWFGCSNALVRYDGYRIEAFDEDDGLITGATSALHCDKVGRLWIGHGREGISVYENGNFRPFHVDSAGTNYVSALATDSRSVYALSTGKNVQRFETSDGKLIEQRGKDDGFIPYCLAPFGNDENPNENVVVGYAGGILSLVSKNMALHEVPGTKIFSASPLADGGYLCGTDRGIIKLLPGKEGYELVRTCGEGARISQLLVDPTGIIWAYNSSELRLTAIDEDHQTNVSSCTGGYSSAVNTMFLDREGNVWVAFSGQGLFKFHQRHILNYSDTDGLTVNYLTSVSKTADGTLHAGSMDGLFVLAGNRLEKIDAVEGSPEFIKQMVETPRGEILVATSGSEFRKSPGKIYSVNHNGKRYKYISANHLLATPGSLYSARWDGVVRKIDIGETVQATDSILLFGSIEKDHKVNVVKPLNGGLICGTVKGLVRVFENGTTKIYGGVFEGMGVNDIAICRNGRVAVCADDGLYIFNSEAGIDAKDFSKFEGHCYLSIDEDDNDNLWVGTDNGLLVIDPAMNIQEFSVDDGIASNNISDVYYDRTANEIYLATANGLSLIDPGKMLNPEHVPFKLNVNGIFKNDTTSIAAGNIRLDEKFESLKFIFTTNTFSGTHNKVYSYKLNDGGWQKLSIPEISITNWNYGKNELVLRADDLVSGIFSEEHIAINVYVPLWRRGPVQAAGLALLVALVYFIFRYRIIMMRRLNQQKIEQVNYIHQLRQQALSASLNPHFIFNCLNSIQYFVNHGDADKADEYLVGFSRLVRFNLNNGTKEFISLHDEMEYLKRYAALENLRMSGTLKFQFDLDENINPVTTKIPTFIIQPFVENAFRHAFEQGQNPKRVSIRIRKVENKLAVTVTDNGKGILDISGAKDPEHRSIGIELVRQKLNLLNDKYGLKCTVEIHDLSEEKTLARGTEVGIVLDGVERFSRAA